MSQSVSAPGPAASSATGPDVTVLVLNARDALKLYLIEAEEKGRITYHDAQALWAVWKVYPQKAANYFSTTTDVLMLQKIAKEFGSPTAKIYLKTYNGKPYIILKGYAGARKVLTGTRYGVENPKIVSMRLTSSGVRESIKEGGIVTICLVTAFDVLDYVLNDKATLGDLIGQVASDCGKVALATGLSLAAETALAGTIISSVALGPLLAAVVIGIGVGVALDWLDDHFHLTEKLKEVTNALVARIRDEAIVLGRETAQAGRQLEAKAVVAGRQVVDLSAEATRVLTSRISNAVPADVQHLLWRTVRDVEWYAVPRI